MGDSYLAIDLDNKGCWVLADEYANVSHFGALGIPLKPHVGETTLSSTFLHRKYRAIRAVLEKARALSPGLQIVFAERSDWHLPIEHGIGLKMKPAPMTDIDAAKYIDFRNRTVLRALGILEGMVIGVTYELGLVYVPIDVHAAKRAITAGGKIEVTKDAVAKVALREYPQFADWGTVAQRQSLCDAAAVLWAGLSARKPGEFYLLRAQNRRADSVPVESEENEPDDTTADPTTPATFGAAREAAQPA